MQVFDSRSELIRWAQDVGIKLNTVVIIAKSDVGQIRKPKLILGCERGGIYRSHHKKNALMGKGNGRMDMKKGRRSKGTKKCNCPFKLRGLSCAGDKWKVEVTCGLHNHPLGETTSGHSYAGRLKDDEQKIVEDLIKSGVKPKEVLTTLKQRNKENKSTMATVYNAQKKFKGCEAEGTSTMQQVMKLLGENDYVEWHTRDPQTNEVLDLFWAHPDSMKLAKCFPSVLMLDSSYKTNRFRHVILEIVGVACTAKTFCVGFAFLTDEKEENYSWALYRLKDVFDPSQLPTIFVTEREIALIDAIHRVFPGTIHLLCTWHITKNVSSNCKKLFQTSEEWVVFEHEWIEIVCSCTETEYADRWIAFENKWKTSVPQCLQYIRDTWLPWKERFVCAWTDKVKHFGNTIVAQAEVGYSRIEKYIGSSQKNFTILWHALHHMIIGEITAVTESLQYSLIRFTRVHRLPALRDLKGYISHHALGLILEETKRSRNIGIDKMTCGCVLRGTHGLPCAHEILDYDRQGVTIPLSACDSHWRKLFIVPTPENYENFDSNPDILRLKKRFQESNDEQRRVLLKKIKEINDPEETLVE